MVAWLPLLFGVIQCNIPGENTIINSTDPNKDMYVINALVYQVGIITNKTDDKHRNFTMGNQEALTFYRTKGSKIDLGAIPAPLLTNVTAESIVQVVPKQNYSRSSIGKSVISWKDLKKDAFLPERDSATSSDQEEQLRVGRSHTEATNYEEIPTALDNGKKSNENLSPEAVSHYRNLFKRESYINNTVKVEKGTVVVPQAAGLQSIGIPPLLKFNSNLSDIPVPIPNSSVVSYAKINTIIRKP